jgi:hypothetical protein
MISYDAIWTRTQKMHWSLKVLTITFKWEHKGNEKKMTLNQKKKHSGLKIGS